MPLRPVVASLTPEASELLLVMYAPKRSVLELWLPFNGPMVHSQPVQGGGCRILQLHSPLGAWGTRQNSGLHAHGWVCDASTSVDAGMVRCFLLDGCSGTIVDCASFLAN